MSNSFKVNGPPAGQSMNSANQDLSPDELNVFMESYGTGGFNNGFGLPGETDNSSNFFISNTFTPSCGAGHHSMNANAFAPGEFSNGQDQIHNDLPPTVNGPELFNVNGGISGNNDGIRSSAAHFDSDDNYEYLEQQYNPKYDIYKDGNAAAHDDSGFVDGDQFATLDESIDVPYPGVERSSSFAYHAEQVNTSGYTHASDSPERPVNVTNKNEHNNTRGYVPASCAPEASGNEAYGFSSQSADSGYGQFAALERSNNTRYARQPAVPAASKTDVNDVELNFPDLPSTNHINLATYLELDYDPKSMTSEDLAAKGDQHLNYVYNKVKHLLKPTYLPLNAEDFEPLPADTPPPSPAGKGDGNDNENGDENGDEHPEDAHGETPQAPATDAPPKPRRLPIYPAYTGRFKTSEEARAHRKRSRYGPKIASDTERVKKEGRAYWVKRIYNAMINIHGIVDGDTSIHRQRFCNPVIRGFDPLDLEAAAHHVFDAAIAVHERGWNRPIAYHKKVIRGNLMDISATSAERRLARICVKLSSNKALVDDAVRGGVTLALLCDNPEARGSTKNCNNAGNKKRGERLALAPPETVKGGAKGAKGAKAAKGAKGVKGARVTKDGSKGAKGKKAAGATSGAQQ